ncbi:MAG: homocysteine S-methyltransferase family protein [Planctomycetes bacterium]|nr:homocysteine S-methyltransferase family protein [Planctomycetota bacterium]
MSDQGEALRPRLERGRMVLDGATGTELERRGVPASPPLWAAAALTTHPDVVEAVHREYIAAGAEIIVANTFRTNQRTLRAAGCERDGAILNQRAVALARRATSTALSGVRPLVAASVAPVEDCYCPELVPPEAVLADEHARMMAWLHEAAPDLVWIETMSTVREARAAARAAAERHLPLAVSFVVQEGGDLLSGERLEDAVAAVEQFAPLALGLNCIPPRGLTAILPRLRQATSRPVSAYAHINNAVPIRGWNYSEARSPAEYAAYARAWVDLGAELVGGCCGTTPAHIRAVRAALRVGR